jgi:hypothetical protein
MVYYWNNKCLTLMHQVSLNNMSHTSRACMEHAIGNVNAMIFIAKQIKCTISWILQNFLH